MYDRLRFPIFGKIRVFRARHVRATYVEGSKMPKVRALSAIKVCICANVRLNTTHPVYKMALIECNGEWRFEIV